VSDRHDVAFSPPAIGTSEIDEVVATLQSGWLTTGPRVADFEREFGAYVGARHAVAVNSCTAALHLSFLVSGIGAGDEVVTTPLTFCATANAIIHAGATPVFADIDRETMNLDPSAVRQAVTPRTRGIVPVHFAGRPAPVTAFRRLCDAAGALLIEDAAHCVEGVSDGRKIGTTGDLTCFSFYTTKNITTGEGGMVTTDSAEWASRLRTLSRHGLSQDAWRREADDVSGGYDVVAAGFKYNMSDIQAALGRRQLARIEALQTRRQAIWAYYDEALADLPIVRPAPSPDTDRHARHLYTVLIDETRCGQTRDQVQSTLRARGIVTAVHYQALHLHRFYARRFGLRRGMFPNAELVSDRTLSLPLSAALSDEDVDRVVVELRAAVSADTARRAA
jgi:dTDP-4-amino-4,6-dideoxygalactose transaminase